MPGSLEFLVRAAAYFLSLTGFALVAWALTGAFLPRTARAGLRLAAILAGMMAVNAVVVQILGLAGVLWPMPYLAFCVAAGIFVLLRFRQERPFRSLLALIWRVGEAWIVRSPYGLGVAAAALLALLVYHSSLVDGMDSLSIQGPLIAGWLQEGDVDLLWYWNYPLSWEYQFAANFLMVGSDSLVVVPRLLACLLFLLLLGEAGICLRLGARSAQWIAWLGALSPLVWGVRGESSLKNDTAMAAGLVLGLLALERVGRRRPGAFFLLQLGLFFLLGTKSTGVVFAALFLVAHLLIHLRGHAFEWRRILAGVALTLIVQTSPAAVQIANFVKNGNPFYPMKIAFGETTLLPGQVSTSGSRIVDHAADPGLWRQLFENTATRLGPEFPLAFFTFLLALAGGLRWSVRNARAPTSVDRRDAVFFLFLGAVLLLWMFFSITPWSARPTTVDGVTYYGFSLRYAIGALALTLLAAAAAVVRWGGALWLGGGLQVSFLFLLYHRWRPSLGHWAEEAGTGIAVFLLRFIIVLLLVIVAWRGISAWRGMKRIRLRSSRWRVAVTFLGGWIVLVAIGGFAEARREKAWGSFSPWVHDGAPVWRHIRGEVPSGTPIAVNGAGPLFRYFALGPRLENRLVHVADTLDRGEIDVPAEIDHLYVAYRRAQRGRMAATRRHLEAAGWRERAADTAGTVAFFERAR